MNNLVRDKFAQRLSDDLQGPIKGSEELISEKPSDYYVTGILYPRNSFLNSDEDETLGNEGKGDSGDDNIAGSLALSKTQKPCTAGLSFALEVSGQVPAVDVTISFGQYKCVWVDKNDQVHEEKPKKEKGEDVCRTAWKRIGVEVQIPIIISSSLEERSLSSEGVEGLSLYIKSSEYEEITTVTIQAINSNVFTKDDGYITREEGHFFQFHMKVSGADGTSIAPRPVRNYIDDEDSRINALIYRNDREYATGHTCSAWWGAESNGTVQCIETRWIPQQKVMSVDASGDQIFNDSYIQNNGHYPDAKFLFESDKDECIRSLNTLVDAYDRWLDSETTKIASIEEESLKKQASTNIKNAKNIAVSRMRKGIEELQSNQQVLEAFKLANLAMQLQASWKDDDKVLKWRPFQLAFCLMSLCSAINEDDDFRDTMDLIWFPTGGGKTEAYLLLTAVTLFNRRLNANGASSSGGVSVFMRYTLRTLTIQQFERASSLICACEFVRRSHSPKTGSLGQTPFSIGLWVGSASTPNKFTEAVQSIKTRDEFTTPEQLSRCPMCDVQLIWEADEAKEKIIAKCDEANCGKKEKCLGSIPVYTVDSEIYRELPSLLIGTVDKFAQIARNQDAVRLFGVNTEFDPPNLIIQDELHLISGPLGTMTGLYETAIDHLCSKDGKKPKIIGSTATIKQANEQIKSLFCRESYQFPPPIIDHENSCFAKLQREEAGRLYLGITTAGRSEKFVLNAVSSSLLQSVQDSEFNDEDVAHYTTLVAYFNSLRVLGGALVVMQDDVEKTLNAYANRRSEKKRNISLPEEMTSRKKSKEIPEILDRLSRNKGDDDFVDILLATNMLSVGVDIPRLGLMLVNGQPKTMSEYIQATSRVGRQSVPGLIVTMYNNNKPRDRAHYESFQTWHQSIYRNIEGSSVTPFAARARDKALHGVLITLARHLIPELNGSPRLDGQSRGKVESEVVPLILKRIKEIDQRELEEATNDIKNILDYWEGSNVDFYWKGKKNTLLVSADDVAQLYAATGRKSDALATPNSMRNVEAHSVFFIKESAKEIKNRLVNNNE